MKPFLAILIIIGGLYGIGFLQALEVADELKRTLDQKSFVEANVLLAGKRLKENH